MGVLNNIREVAGKVCMDTLHYHNSPLIMSQCGSKGSPINIAQMVACVGQQSVSGKRCFNGFKERTLPHFPRGDKTPAGGGKGSGVVCCEVGSGGMLMCWVWFQVVLTTSRACVQVPGRCQQAHVIDSCSSTCMPAGSHDHTCHASAHMQPTSTDTSIT